MDSFVISCDDCVMLHTPACDDCVVSAVLGHAAHEALVMDAEEAAAVGRLERAGLLPGLRHTPRAG